MCNRAPRVQSAESVETFVAAVLAHYLKERRGATVRELSERLDWSESRVRRVAPYVFKCEGWHRVTPTREPVEVYDRSYSAYLGDRMVQAWEPKKSWLADLLIQAREGA